MTQIHQHTLDNGLTLLGESMPGCQSVSLTLLTGASAAAQPDTQLGVGSKLPDAWSLITNMAVHPNLSDDALEPCRDLALQGLQSLADEPRQKVMYNLKGLHYAAPYNRNPMGEKAAIEALTLDQIRAFHNAACVPAGAVLGVAGHFDWEQVVALAEASFADWTGNGNELAPTTEPKGGYDHEHSDTQQIQIAMAYDAPMETDPNADLHRIAVACLSGGMSGRLFTEVREKRGLCYAVFASYGTRPDAGTVTAYAGTTTARAQETLDVMRSEIEKISEGVSQDEFDRAVVGLRSRLVMQGESTSARSTAIASDQVVIGRPRTLQERAEAIEPITLDQLNAYLADHPWKNPTLATIGSAELQVS